MESIIAIIFGIVQGITEFVPVSSSGHLVLLHEFLPSLQLSDELAFDVALHIGTLIALIAVFWKDCVTYIKRAFVTPQNTSEKDERRLAWLIVLAIIPAGVVGLFLEDIIELYLRSTVVVIIMLILVSIVFILVEKFGKNLFTHSLSSLRWTQALFIGCMQILALIPGTSRSGITIVAGMMTRLKRDQAARFSFLISIPLILGAGLKKGVDLITIGIQPTEIPILLLGMVSAAIVGYLAIHFLLSFLSRKTLYSFAVYRLVLAGLVILITFLT